MDAKGRTVIVARMRSRGRAVGRSDDASTVRGGWRMWRETRRATTNPKTTAVAATRRIGFRDACVG